MKLPFSMLRSGLALSACVLSLACGHNDDDLFSSGLDDTRRASTLDDDDKRSFCRTLDRHVDVVIGFEEVARVACLPAALLTGGTRAGCERLLDDCAANAPAPITITGTSTSERACFDDLSSCEADVGALEACVNINVGVVRNVLERITCARFGDATAADEARRVMDTANSCAGTSASCGDATAPTPYLL